MNKPILIALEHQIERIPAAVAILDRHRRVQVANARLESMLGYDRDGLRGAEWELLIHPADRGLDDAQFSTLCDAGGTTYQVERRMRRIDGTEFPARLNLSVAIPSAYERPLLMVLVEDISEVHMLAASVAERRKELAALTTLARGLIDTVDPRSSEWMHYVVNLVPPAFQWPTFTAAAVQIGSRSAHSPGYAMGKSRAAPSIRNEWVNAQGALCFLEALYTGPDTNGNPFLPEEYTLLESLAEMIRVAVRNSEQTLEGERMRDELSSSEIHLEMALDAVRMGIVDIDLTSDEIRLSDSACEIFALVPRANAYSRDELRDRVHPEDREQLDAYFAATRTEYVVDVREYRLLLPDGTIRWVNTRGRLFVNRSGVAVRQMGVVVDITEQRLLEAQYRQAQKMEAVGLLAGGIAHDFNNLLTIIGTTSEVAQTELAPDHVVVSDLEEIRTAVERDRALTRQLLTFCRRDVVRRLRVDVGPIVENMAPMLRRVTGPTLSLTMSIDTGPMVVLADANQLEQVVLNLVVNARDAMLDGGEIRISVRPCVLDDISVLIRPGLAPGRYALLTCSDNGSGMDASTQARIFEPFFTTKGAAHGTGLGLSSVFGIVKQANGHVGVYSEPGKGTTFRIYLPLLDASDIDARLGDPVDSTLPRGTETILLVDDEEALRKVTHRILTELGYDVLQAGDGREAVSMLRSHPGTIDLLLCDIALPGHDGREVSESMSLTRQGVPTLFMSGYAADVAGERLYLDPQALFLEKPFTRAALAQLVRAALDGSALVSE